MRIISIKALISFSLLLAFLAFLPRGAATAAKLQVVTTTTDLESIAETIGGNQVEVSSIATGVQDPHFIEAKPSFMMLAKNADLWIRIGLDLEIAWERKIIDGSRNTKIRIGVPGHLDACEWIEPLEVPTGEVDRSLGDIHPYGNPHYWLDPYNGILMAWSIANRLGQLRPAKTQYFWNNYFSFWDQVTEAMFGKELVKQLGGNELWTHELEGDLDSFLAKKNATRKLGGWAGTMKPFRGKKIVTYHRSWPYFVHRFGLVAPYELEPKPGIPPSPGHVLEVINKMKNQRINVLLVEPFYSRKAPDLVAEKTGATVVLCANSVGGTQEGDDIGPAKDYLSLINYIVDSLVAAF